VTLHDHVAAKPRFVGPQSRQGLALGRPDQAGRHGEAAAGQGFSVDHGDILPRRARFFYPLPA
jgi:hypothetical protein